MNDLTKNLIKELKAAHAVSESRMLQMFVAGLEANVNASGNIEQALVDLAEVSEKLQNTELDAIVKKFNEMSNTPAKKLKMIENGAAVLPKIAQIKESAAYADPIFKTVVAGLEKYAMVNPEPIIIESVIAKLKPFSFDSTVKSVVSDLTTYVAENRATLAIFNTIADLKKAPNAYYAQVCEKLEGAILEGRTSVDALTMILAEATAQPVIKNLLNKLSQFESSKNGGFNLGSGNNSTKINPVIGVYTRTANGVRVLIENHVIDMNDEEEAEMVPFSSLPQEDEFTQTAKAYTDLGFKPTEHGVEAKGKANTIAFKVSPEGEVSFEINGKVAEDLNSSEIYKTLVVETISFKQNVAKILENANMIAQFEFVQRFVTEGAQSYAINTDKAGIFVLDRQGLKKYDTLGFHKYVAETFKYDVSDLFAIQLSERQEFIKSVNERKAVIQSDIAKLEESIAQLDSVIEDADEETQDQLETLKQTINSSIVGLKDEYLNLDDSLVTDPILGSNGTNEDIDSQYTKGAKVMYNGMPTTVEDVIGNQVKLASGETVDSSSEELMLEPEHM
jgi:hypothetical protein